MTGVVDCGSVANWLRDRRVLMSSDIPKQKCERRPPAPDSWLVLGQAAPGDFGADVRGEAAKLTFSLSAYPARGWGITGY